VDVVWLIDRAAGEVRKKLEAPGTGITSLAFSPDGKELLAVGPASCVRIWNVSTEEDTAARLTLDDNSPEAMWTTKGIPLVADIGPAGLTVTDARTGKSVVQVDGPVKKFAISPTGTAIAIAKKTSVVIRPIE
jgi:WD40 repeat protein